ncbi:unnamed protein product [Thlaspi arvense]|uniref:Pectate lyase n=1 Tax=Thlaspi arvense TaxID=13288 RepID=A0AAU9T277_THLAR|nr:unnamed protein product [Thlaspi arvense]
MCKRDKQNTHTIRIMRSATLFLVSCILMSFVLNQVKEVEGVGTSNGRPGFQKAIFKGPCGSNGSKTCINDFVKEGGESDRPTSCSCEPMGTDHLCISSTVSLRLCAAFQPKHLCESRHRNRVMERVLSVTTIFLVLALPGRCSDVNIFSRNDFPQGFVFGSATSAYQWEGAFDEDGKKPSVWDTFLHSRNLDNGDIACDGYHKYKEDVQLMVKTGLDAFRFSISWSRLIPNGRGPVNPKGLQFYKNFIQELVINGIEPHVTLYHYDHPQYLEDEYGGWINRRIIEDFTAYADVCFREFGNHVKFWTTINEPNIFAIGSYNDGATPPGGSVGFSIFAIGFNPSTSSKDDEIATQRAKAFHMDWMLRPLVFGEYPNEMKRSVGSRLPVFSEEESEQVKGSSDFLGIIHYFGAIVTNIKFKPSLSRNPDFRSDLGVSVSIVGNFSAFEYAVSPWAMEGVLEYIKQSYGNPPVYILENGRPMKQDLQLQEKDTPRIEYLHAYIGAVLKSVRNGSDTRGYFVWSFMDLYELLRGYKFSFGLYSVNFSDPHLKRSPKLSAHWYSAFLKGKPTFLGSQGIKKWQSNFSSSAASFSIQASRLEKCSWRSTYLPEKPQNIMNPVDSCWRLKSDWAANRKDLANCAVGFGSSALGGKKGNIYVVTNPSDNAANPQPGSLRYGVIQDKPLWITFAKDMVMLLGHNDGFVQDVNMKVTVAFNHFGPGLVERMPRVRRGYAHVANNRYDKWIMYAIGGSADPTIFSEGNYFIASDKSNSKEVTKREVKGGWNNWRWRTSKDVFKNGAYFVPSGYGSIVLPYSSAQRFPVAPGNMVPSLTADAGPLNCNRNRPCY